MMFVENWVCGEYFVIIVLMVVLRLVSCCWIVLRLGCLLMIFCWWFSLFCLGLV